MMKRILSLFLSLLFAFSCLPLTVFASETTEESASAVVYVESTHCMPGDTVKVNINISGNPGIAGARFSVTLDEGMSLLGVSETNCVFESLDFAGIETTESPYILNWDSLNAVASEDGTVITLELSVSSETKAGDKLDIGLSYNYGDVYNYDLESVAVTMVSGQVRIIDYKPGDVNEDKTINGKDVTLIRRYNAGGSVEIRTEAADVNDDGVINGKDVTLIRRHNAGGNISLLPSTPECSHTLTATAAKAATCTEAGNIAYWYCDSCEMYFTDEAGTTETTLAAVVIPQMTTHDTYEVPKKEATCAEAGNIAYWKCEDCGKLFTTESADVELTASQTVINKTEHTYSDVWLYDKDNHWHVAICGHDLIKDRVGHTYDANNACIVCDYVKDERVTLATPANVKVESDTVTWTKSTEDASVRYLVRSGDYSYTTYDNSVYVFQLTNSAGQTMMINPADPNPINLSIQIMALGDDTNYKDSAWSDICTGTYVPNSTSEEKIDELVKYRLGYSYDFINDEYFSVGKVKTNQVLNPSKLLTLASYSPTNNTKGYSDYYSYSSVDEYISKFEDKLKANIGFDLPVVGGLKAQLDYQGQRNFNSYKYNSMFVVEVGVTLKDHILLNLTNEDILACVDFEFLRDIKGQNGTYSDKTALAKAIYEKYGTHVILGVTTGASYLAQYSISTNNEEVHNSANVAFNLNGSADIAKVIELDIGLETSITEDNTVKSSETEALLTVEWSGSSSGAVTSPEELDAAVKSWESGITEGNAVRLVMGEDDNDPNTFDGGAISISSIIRTVDSDLADAFDAYIADLTTDSYDDLYGRFDVNLDRILGTPVDENGESVLYVDLSAFQSGASMENAYDPNFVQNILTVYPYMFGTYIDKIVVKGSLDEYQTIIDKFTLKLEGSWTRPVDIVIENLGVKCTTDSLIDLSSLSDVDNINISYSGICLIEDQDGKLVLNASTGGNDYSFTFNLAEGETIDLSTVRIQDGCVYLPTVQKVGYDFNGWKSVSTPVTDKNSMVLSSFIPSVSVTPLSANWVNKTYTITLNNNGADLSDGTQTIKQVYSQNYTDTDGTKIEYVTIPEKTGYIFEGYYTEDSTQIIDETGRIVKSSIYFDGESSQITLYAKWRTAIYKIILSPGEGLSNTPTDAIYVKYGVGFYSDVSCENELGSMIMPTKDAYSFAGYKYGETDFIDAAGALMQGNDFFAWDDVEVVTGEAYEGVVTVEAEWSQNIVITLDTELAENAEATKFIYQKQGDASTYYSDVNCTNVITQITLPARTGYTFGGYYKSIENNNTVTPVGTILGIKTNGTITTDLEGLASDGKWTPMWILNVEVVLENNDATTKGTTTYYQKYNVGYYQDIDCKTAFNDNKIAVPEKDGYTFKGYYGSVSNNNSVNATGTNQYISETGIIKASTTEFNGKTELYALWIPNTYVISYDLGEEGGGGLLQYPLADIAYSGNNATIKYNAANRTYTFTNSGTSDPFVQLGYGVYLEAGKTYYVHMTVNNSNTSAIQMFYAINGAFTESQSIRLGGENDSTTITVPTSGNYNIRIDNDTGTTIVISDFWITAANTTSVTDTYGTTYDKLPTPTSPYYTFDGWYYGNTKITSTTNLLAYSNHTLTAKWSKSMPGYTYMDQSTGFTLGSSGNYLMVSDISLNGSGSSISSFSGILDGNGFTISGWTGHLDFNGVHGLIRTNTGTIKNLTIKAFVLCASSCDHDIHGTHKAGLLCGVNGGTIENVTVSGGVLSVNIGSLEDDHYSYAHVGALCGLNQGTIKNCSASAYIYVNVGTYLEDAEAYVGGLVGYSYGGTLANCNSTNAVLVVKVEAAVERNWLGIETGHGRPKLYVGGVLGYSQSANCSGLTLSGVNKELTVERDCNCSTNTAYYNGDTIGYSA